ncbi:MAG: dihydrofolate reductase [Eubacteriales bacterium]|nr:dihydrofolate reductase [Eubacteriales bacterium]MDD4389604.1 dihydrofolate reductase [Eubacteriales bacterium]
MKSIVAADENWGIGKDNELLAHIPGDLKYFKENTLGKVLIMGRKTVESLPGGRPLPGRTTIILTKNDNYSPAEAKDGSRVIICNSQDEIEALLLKLKEDEGLDLERDVIVAGGETIYNMFLPKCKEFLVTKICHVLPADKHFPNLDKLAEGGELKLIWESEPVSENGLTYKFTRYKR